MSLLSKPVVFTCLFGNYETLNEQPVAKASRVPFLCFTDRPDLAPETWITRTVDPLFIDPARESRRVKLLPHLYLKEFTESIYVDGTCILKKTPEELLRTYLPSRSPNFVCLRHPFRDCVYDEAEEVLRADMEPEARVREQMDHYHARRFPRHAGLISGGFLLRRHHKKDVIKQGEAWFSHVLRYSKRDQLSFNFTARQTGLDYTALDLDLTNNDLVSWPHQVDRLPYHFNDATYLWLNPDVARAGVDAREHYHRYGRSEGRPLRYHVPIELNRLANKFRSDKGDLYFNRHFYSRVYDYYLSALRSEEMTVLEIGLLRHDVQAAGAGGPFRDAPSLSMWSEYFSRAEIHGVDIASFADIATDRITFTQADQSDRGALRRVVDRSRYPIRVMVDDGSHASQHQQISLAALFPYLESGGLYFIEDLNYQPAQWEAPGAIKTKAWLQSILGGRPMASEFVSEDELAYLTANIGEIQFYDSMDYAAASLGQDSLAVIRKK